MSSEEQAISMTQTSKLENDRRQGVDRRRHTWRTVTYCGLHGRGRRRQARRADHSYYLDHYNSGIVMTGLLVLFLSCVDALFTLTLLSRGAYEANAFMAHLLERGEGIFIVAKIAITALGITFLMMHAHFRLLRITSGKRMLQLMAGIYGLLICWELLLLGTI